MPRYTIAHIRERIRRQQYDMTFHAVEEMAEDNLDIEDLEYSILNGSIARIDRGDPRGTKYVVEGVAVDQITPVGSAGRFVSPERYLIITVYEVTKSDE
ncbi:MAG: DUF4258 domain-containing protein [Caldilinea sp. CFX5]|nr:DUF4258 domain-containing protein [Caldilinea sp. CFX5]